MGVLIAPDDGRDPADDHQIVQRPVAHGVDVVLDVGAHLVEGSVSPRRPLTWAGDAELALWSSMAPLMGRSSDVKINLFTLYLDAAAL